MLSYISFKKSIKQILSFFISQCKILLQNIQIRSFFIWEGIYNNYDQIIVKKKSWNENILEEQYYSNILKIVNNNTLMSFLPFDASEEYILLPLLIAPFAREKSEITILDFGGGLGISYVQLKRCLVKNVSIQYHIVETESMCKFSKSVYNSDPNIHFHTIVPTNLGNIDIIYLSSALQYIKEYKILLENLCRLNATYIFLVKLSSGEFPTYFAKQINEKNCEMPYIFINIHEIIGIMEKAGYSVIYKSVLPREYNQDNFPKQYRMNKTCNVLFEK